MSEQYDIVEAQRAMLALVGVDVDGMTETLFRFGALGGDVDLGGVVEMLRELSDKKHDGADRQRFRLFKKRGHQIATMVLVVQDCDSVYDYEQQAHVVRTRICIGAALCRRNGDPSPGSAWPRELKGWSRSRPWRNVHAAQAWLKRAPREDDRVCFNRVHLPQMIAALEGVIAEREEESTS